MISDKRLNTVEAENTALLAKISLTDCTDLSKCLKKKKSQNILNHPLRFQIAPRKTNPSKLYTHRRRGPEPTSAFVGCECMNVFEVQWGTRAPTQNPHMQAQAGHAKSTQRGPFHVSNSEAIKFTIAVHSAPFKLEVFNKIQSFQNTVKL